MGVEELDDVLPPSLWLDPWEREILDILERMDESVDAVVVEGPNDTEALRRAGVETKILECTRCSRLYRVSDRLSWHSVAILTDFDEHGRHLNGRLRELLSDRDVELRWRRELGLVLTQRGRYDIESLQNVFESISLADRRI